MTRKRKTKKIMTRDYTKADEMLALGRVLRKYEKHN